MKNSEKPAFPRTHRNGISANGLTKREYFAAMAMQGILSSTPIDSLIFGQSECKLAVGIADELLKQLEK